MESIPLPRNSDDPSAVLAAADQARQRLAAGLRLPTGLPPALAAAVAIQVGTAAYGIASRTIAGLGVALPGMAVFLLVAALALHRFRRINGVRVDGLASQNHPGHRNHRDTGLPLVLLDGVRCRPLG